MKQKDAFAESIHLSLQFTAKPSRTCQTNKTYTITSKFIDKKY